MEMYSKTYKLIRETDPESPLVKAMNAEYQAHFALEEAMKALREAKREAKSAEIDHYATCMSDARVVFGDKPFTAKEFEEAVGGYVSKHSIASMVACRQDPELSYSARTRTLLPPDLEYTGNVKAVVTYSIACDSNGKPIEGAEPIKRTSKGSKLYKFED